MSIQTKLIAFLLLILGVLGYGYWQNKKGYNQAQLEAKAAIADLEIKYRAKEQEAQKKADTNYAEYEAQKVTTQKTSDSLAATTNGLRNQVAIYKRRLSETSGNPAGAIAAGTVGIDLFAECADRYSNMAKEAGRLADKVNALIDQATTKE